MAKAKVILIAAPELIPALRERVGSDDQVLTFADSDPLRAMEAIAAERPPVVALERLFAASPRGAALIARIKDDPSLDATRDPHPLPRLRAISASRRAGATPPPAEAGVETGAAVRHAARGDAPRFKMKESAVATVNGRPPG